MQSGGFPSPEITQSIENSNSPFSDYFGSNFSNDELLNLNLENLDDINPINVDTNVHLNCQQCNLSFPTNAELRKHVRKNHQNEFTLFREGMPAITIQRTAGEPLKCPGCLKDYKTIQTLQRHYRLNCKKLSAPSSVEQIREQAPQVDEFWSTNDHLQNFKLFYNQQSGLLLCTNCRNVILGNKAAQHAKECNGNQDTNTVIEEVRSLQLIMDTQDHRFQQLSSTQTLDYPIPELHIHRDFFKCFECNKIIKNKKHIIEHINQNHPEARFGQLIQAQVLFYGKNRLVAEIGNPNQEQPLDQNEISLPPSFEVVQPKVEIAPSLIVRKLKFNSIIETLGQQDARKLIESNPEHFEHLKNSVFQLLKAVNVVLLNGSHRHIQKDIGNKCNSFEEKKRPFSGVERDATLEIYSRTVAKMIVMKENLSGGLYEDYSSELVAARIIEIVSQRLDPSQSRVTLDVCKFLAVLSWVGENRFASPGVISQYAAHLSFAYKCSVFERIRMSGSVDHLELVDVCVHSGFSFLLDCLALCRETNNYASPMKLYFIPDKTGKIDFETISCNGKVISTSMLQTVVKRAIQDAERALSKLSFNQKLYLESIGNIKDIVSATEPRYSFLSDENNEWIRKKSDGFFRFLAANPQGPFIDPAAKSEYTKLVEKLQEYLILFTFITTGQSPRLSEICMNQSVYNESSNRRNCFIIMNHLCFLYTYNKTGPNRLIARFFDDRVARIILKYLVYIRPVYMKINGLGNQNGLFVRATTNLTPERISTIITKQFIEYASVNIFPREYRHISTMLVRYNIKVFFNEDENVWDEQRGHSTLTAQSTYGRLDNLVIPDFNEEKMLKFYFVSKEWHKFLGISKKRTIGKYSK